MRCAKISVSVSDANLWPLAASAAFSSRWFSMMPLCTTATPPYACGWAFSSDGRPCVAQRVCPMPVQPASGRVARARVDEVLELALRALDGEAGRADHRDAGGVVAAVLELPQAADDEIDALPRTRRSQRFRT